MRLKGYDYSQAGAYFVTICTQGRACLFGEVVYGEMRLNDAGRMVVAEWERLPALFPNVVLDAFVVMPNHIHGIVILTDPADDATDGATAIGATISGATTGGATTRVAPTTARDDATPVGAGLVPAPSTPALSTPAPTLGDVIGAFKSRVTVEYIRGVKTFGWTPFDRRLWQRNYYEHIIRNEETLNCIRRYIAENPIRWAFDRENPFAVEIESEETWLR
jgi:REP element-mobilizing transposase RayT